MPTSHSAGSCANYQDDTDWVPQAGVMHSDVYQQQSNCLGGLQADLHLHLISSIIRKGFRGVARGSAFVQFFFVQLNQVREPQGGLHSACSMQSKSFRYCRARPASTRTGGGLARQGWSLCTKRPRCAGGPTGPPAHLPRRQHHVEPRQRMHPVGAELHPSQNSFCPQFCAYLHP